MRINKTEIKKTRNTFTYKNKKVYPTNNEFSNSACGRGFTGAEPQYFTTYKTNINKATKKIMNIVNNDEELINKNKINIMIDLMKYLN